MYNIYCFTSTGYATRDVLTRYLCDLNSKTHINVCVFFIYVLKIYERVKKPWKQMKTSLEASIGDRHEKGFHALANFMKYHKLAEKSNR